MSFKGRQGGIDETSPSFSLCGRHQPHFHGIGVYVEAECSLKSKVGHDATRETLERLVSLENARLHGLSLLSPGPHDKPRPRQARPSRGGISVNSEPVDTRVGAFAVVAVHLQGNNRVLHPARRASRQLRQDKVPRLGNNR